MEAKVVSVRTSVDPKATAAGRAMPIVLFWLPMFLRHVTVVSAKVGIMISGNRVCIYKKAFWTSLGPLPSPDP